MSTEADSLLQELDPQQLDAARHEDGPAVVFAGAGSGKTRVITTRVAYLISLGIRPWEILALTFTNKAAGEMRRRVVSLVADGKRTHIATFHSQCARWLREFAQHLGFSSDFTIYDEADSTAALKEAVRQLNLALPGDDPISELRRTFGRLKTLGLTPQDVERQYSLYRSHLTPEGLLIYRKYQEYLASCNAMDFGDLIVNVLLLLRTRADIRETLQMRYRHVMVDEYQDTNSSQFELLSTLAAKHRNLYVVGDDDQSIYSWRGAVPANILNFEEHFPGAKRFILGQNYRSTGLIVRAAQQVIRNNTTRAEKEIFTSNADGELIEYRLENDGDTEAWWIAGQIRDELASFTYDQIAVFYRTNAQSRVLESALRHEGIPYKIYGTVGFFERQEVKDLLAYMRLCVNERDDVSFRRIFNVPTRGLGERSLDLIAQKAREANSSLYETSVNAVEEVGRSAVKLAEFVKLLEAVRRDAKELPLIEFFDSLLKKTSYFAYLRKKFPDKAQDKLDNVHEFGAALGEFGTDFPEAGIKDWLESVSLQTIENEDKAGATVSLMTLHMAKGLEFRKVYVCGLEDGLLPHKNTLTDHDAIEEERRLFYVGMTRARERLILTAAERRRTFQGYVSNQVSRFLHEVPRNSLRVVIPEFAGGSGQYAAGGSSEQDGLSYEYDGESSGMRVGGYVSHATYGRGQITRIVDDFGVTKCLVNFFEFGMRKVPPHHLRVDESNWEFDSL